MTRLDAAISLVIFSTAVGCAWCALNYQAPFAGYFGLGLFVIAAAWLEASEDATSRIEDTKRLTHYTWRKKYE